MFKYVCVDADLLGEEHGVFAASIRSYCIQTLLELLVQMVQCLWLSVLAYEGHLHIVTKTQSLYCLLYSHTFTKN